MQVAQGELGRVFVLRLEDGERIPDCVEEFAAAHGVTRALCALLGGIGSGRVVVGPREAGERPVVPLIHALEGVHEAAALGTIFPDEQGLPRLHMHAAMGRGGETRTGCVRPGVEVWQLGEVVVLEILGTDLDRRVDPATGFAVLAAGEPRAGETDASGGNR